ncbi:AraC family transcriptional regulator [Nonomuraea sp. NPDC050153]|uniref:AraC family transcriptional regulator n=1 Tax=Nonomuraea sp. NPDC050153 TaxID=3364359 RepID=UPI0037AFBF38
MAEHDDPRLNQAVIPPSVLAGIVEIGQREGLPIVSWFSGTGLDPAQIVTSGTVRVSFRQAAAVLRRAVRAMPGRPLGMQVGGRDLLISFGMLGVAMRSCATAGDALALALELHQASGTLLDVEAETFGQEVALRLHERGPDPELVAFLCEEALCSTLVFIRSMFGADWAPTCVELTYPAPPYAERYRRFFRCPVRFGADANRVVFAAALLRQTFPTHYEPTRAVAVDACRRLLDLDDARPDITVAVEALLNRNLRHPLTMTEAAHHLHVTERTLRRQLTAAGERYSAIRDRVRERRATFLLRESALSIDAIAHEIGFSDAREFRRAYIRWTGHPPSATRKA